MNPLKDVLNVEFIDQVQSSLRCCGLEDFDDFNGDLPPSCDSLKSENFYKDIHHFTFFYFEKFV